MVSTTSTGQMRQLVEDLQTLEDRLRQGGGAKRIEKQHRDGKLTARERIAKLIDPGSMFLEIGLLIAYDQYDGQAPAAGVVTGARQDRRPPRGDRRQRRHRESRRVVAGDHHQDPARAGNRHAQPPADRLSGGFGRRESAVIRTASFRASTARRGFSTTTR